MKLLLFSIPIITTLVGFGIYRFQDGKQRELFKLDLVQFMYLFVLTPTLYVWLKSFLFFFLRNELTVTLSLTDIFVIDTVFSVVAFFTFAALAIHSLTKTFWLKRHHDPDFDLFHLSEYFHLYWTHVVIWTGGVALVSLVSFINVFIPIQVVHQSLQFYSVLGIAAITGLFTFMGIWGSDPGQGNFMRIMKLELMLAFVGHVLMYFLFDPNFKMPFGAFWFSLFCFLFASVASFFFDKSSRVEKMRGLWLHVGWGENIQLFPIQKRKK
ncbi:MAG: hypothetical protein GW762_05585 [Candidatus Pacebacteria bacterium]|nr:hypothetical protein [Candidatus Paceibacterota bacterium]PIR63624.1 MAG: hypothetical protein COU64_03445 [Candidatus Pacebacteria bacterium CG10_big_fil_rev_8_21_14_0_10_40_26]PIZ78726.1 MAG: hypothetical protein COY01_03815 [Candidatus Pacebacteria bacterium CG_4_10_14_0_2_um_filter_40_20]PJA68422.1 MAG: hypothetical protein CO156_05500 [Candidatus Pacebacteria bacterium CG_4_9_14_3_um_filter_40_12]PJC41284.1 MAG: hypothetical protein CO041_05570 [Candidatus Pacebacteria bacterium CG_4_9_